MTDGLLLPAKLKITRFYDTKTLFRYKFRAVYPIGEYNQPKQAGVTKWK